ncbi:Bifunctional riboflavin kinase/FMN adenylyltransferase [Buchnera aphidicola (Protaphis terricola)]|uniref:bifunctional riboflavin kinase/FAD synthetase n=1 Tax=Buchnera aphidicola TaxID=9 RepID=UPI003464DE61
MKIIRGIYHLKKINSNSVVSIGNFDGVHLGHQKLLSTVYKIGTENNMLKIIILFEPQPLEFFNNKNPPKRITKFFQKIKYIELYKIDIVICIKFNKFFSNLNPKEFVKKILIKKLNIKFIISGEDFKFGSKRNGNISFLEKISKKYNFSIIKIKSIYKNNIKVSSTNIRKYLLKNDIESAKLLLGRRFSIIGRVIYGKQIGRKLGFPTANIKLNNNISINNGVYAVKVNYFLEKKIYLGICNIGIKPSFNNIKINKLLEVHLFNTDIDLYEKKIEIFLYKKIRNEYFFTSQEKLKKQIFEDVKIVKQYFNILDQNLLIR